jgi:hypothetical protein
MPGAGLLRAPAGYGDSQLCVLHNCCQYATFSEASRGHYAYRHYA